MRTRFVAGLLSLLLFHLFSPVVMGDHLPELYITGVWARPTASAEMSPGTPADPASVSAAYLTIENASEEVVTLVSASTPAADSVEIHETQMGTDDVMRMRPVENGITIEPGAQAVLEPGGYHIMLRDLQNELLPGEAFSLLLTFEAGNGTLFEMLIGVPVLEEMPEASPIVITDAWARPAVMGDAGGISAVYLTLHNRGETDDAVIAAQTSAADVVELHTMTIGAGDVMQMRPIEALAIPTGEMAVLEPGGDHVMLIDLQRDLVVTEAIVITLVFESGREQMIAVPVRDPLTEEMGHNRN
jgi:hypothetical protein